MICDVSRFVNVESVLGVEDSFSVSDDPVVGLNVSLVVSMVTALEVEVRVRNVGEITEDVCEEEDDGLNVSSVL